MTQEALNIAGQCRATASSPLAKNISVDEGNGLLTELLLDAARVIEALAQPEQEPKIGCVNHDCDQCKAQPEQEPVAWTLLLTGEHHGLVGKAGDKFVGHPEHYERVDVYTAPPQRKPLTVWEIELWAAKPINRVALCRAIEAAHGIKEDT